MRGNASALTLMNLVRYWGERKVKSAARRLRRIRAVRFMHPDYPNAPLVLMFEEGRP